MDASLRTPPILSPALSTLWQEAALGHRRVESGLRIALPGAGRHVYSRYAAAMWGWLQPIEIAVWSGGWPSEVDVPARAVKARWLEEDLERARQDGYLQGDLVRREDRPAFTSLAERMGYAFVVESAVLGARGLRRRVAPAIFPWPARFLSGYGEEAEQRWEDFLGVVAAHLDSSRHVDDAVRGAHRAFDTLESWFHSQGAA